MSATTLRILIAAFLIAHGWIHYSLTTVPVPAPGALQTPFWPSWLRPDTDPKWPISRMGLPAGLVRNFGSILWLATVAGFCLAGLGLFGIPGLKVIWQGAAIFGAAASMLLLGFYWHPWLVMGAIIDLAALTAIWQEWPAALFTSK
jgi:hypothetical protein